MKRNYGIDMAKFLSMFMVIVLHNLLQGGVLSFTNISLNNMGYWLLENLAIPAVNIFAIISGYLMVDKKFKLSRITSLWKVVLFWSVIPTVIIMYVTKSWNNIELIKSLFPVILKRYWYFSAYIGVLLLSPFINAGFKALKQKQIELILGILLTISCTVGFLGKFFLDGGYSMMWLLIMYMTGAYLRKTTRNFIKINSWILFLVVVLCAVLSLLGEMVSIGAVGHTMEWLSYSSPFIVTQSILIFLIFKRINVQNDNLKKKLKVLTPLTFSIYLIDTNPTFFNFLHDKFSFVREQSLLIGCSYIIIISLLLFVVFILLDYIRSLIFKMFPKTPKNSTTTSVHK